ncbi:unnamed protein product [Pleuronectes platessa]|uniref:Uncharacterized protein n=1 Tax=Pleuronectes platessa TaxID=8262 RepID=A0A9N7W0W7_PLEPL|nr:unnamed protein product [Pleuronectes platessa]
MAPGHSPSWMRTLMRRNAPPLALARNSLSSGVTTSARNMAAQQCLPPARHSSRGVERQKKQQQQKGKELHSTRPPKNLSSQETVKSNQKTLFPVSWSVKPPPHYSTCSGESDPALNNFNF